MRRRPAFLIIFATLIIFSTVFAQGSSNTINKGVWVSVFSQDKVLYSKKAIIKLIETCKRAGINHIYLQVYQSGKAYYNSKISDRSKYEEALKSCGVDPVSFLLEEAVKNDIKVYAWVNLLSLGQNENAQIIKKFGSEILTKDQYNRPSGRKDPNDSDKYFLREEQLFLEPGDGRVAKYLITVVEEIVCKYPLFSGVHLDYARYPMTVPFIPGSRFTKQGLSYGYGEKNIERFMQVEKVNPLTGLKTESDYFKWDQWRRQQITSLVRRINNHVKKRYPRMLVSCAVIPAGERAYLSMLQDWPYWLEEGLLDYVVLMNYATDNQLTKTVIRSALGLRGRGKVFVGIGAFLIKDNKRFIEQYKMVSSLKPDGIVVFSYDDINEELASLISQIN